MNEEIGKINPALMGSIVSEGTLKKEDIVEKISLLVSAGDIECQKLDQFIDEFYEALAEEENEDYHQTLDEIYDDICQTLSDLADYGFYFGGLDGDPACIGFWWGLEVQE